MSQLAELTTITQKRFQCRRVPATGPQGGSPGLCPPARREPHEVLPFTRVSASRTARSATKNVRSPRLTTLEPPHSGSIPPGGSGGHVDPTPHNCRHFVRFLKESTMWGGGRGSTESPAQTGPSTSRAAGSASLPPRPPAPPPGAVACCSSRPAPFHKHPHPAATPTRPASPSSARGRGQRSHPTRTPGPPRPPPPSTGPAAPPAESRDAPGTARAG